MLAELYPKQYTHIANQCDNNNNNNGTRKTNDSLPFDWNKTGIDLLMESKTEKSTEKHKNGKAQKIQEKKHKNRTTRWIGRREAYKQVLYYWNNSNSEANIIYTVYNMDMLVDSVFSPLVMLFQLAVLCCLVWLVSVGYWQWVVKSTSMACHGFTFW